MSRTPITTDLPFWAALSHITSLGPIGWQKLLTAFPSMSDVWQAKPPQLQAAGLEPKLVQAICHQRKAIDPNQVFDQLQKQRINMLPITDPTYPELLKQIYGPPPLLYSKGQLDWRNVTPLAIVGTRKPTDYGQRVTKDLVGQLTNQGLGIVSGLALGIDGIAARAALAQGGTTVAVLGCGLDEIYPRSHVALGQQIIEQGGQLVSEFPLGTLPLKQHFPRRNRIVSGLSLGTLVIEAGEKSGALITARYAVEQNRDVFAVPGNIYHDQSKGTHRLIEQGATLVQTAADILEVLGLPAVSDTAIAFESESAQEQAVWQHLSTVPIHVDKIVQLSRLNISSVNATLAILEMKSVVQHLGQQQYVRRR